MVTCHTRQTRYDWMIDLGCAPAGQFFFFFNSSIKNQSTMEIRPRRILPTTEWISRQTEKSRVVFEKTRCVRECVGLKETRRNQTHWPWFRSWLHLLSVRRHTHAQMHHAIASLGIVCTWHWFLTDRPTCERTTCKCAHVFRPRKQDSALFFFSPFILLLSIQSALRIA